MEEPKIGVYVCWCGTNIAKMVDVEAVINAVKDIENVTVAKNYKYMCSDPGQELIENDIREQNLTRVVVASCSPRTHEPLFQETIQEAGLNRYLFELANIRDQCSWVHQKDKGEATEKSKDLVRMAVSRAATLKQLEEKVIPVNKQALVVGGGIAGIQVSLDLAKMGFQVHLVERSPSTQVSRRPSSSTRSRSRPSPSRSMSGSTPGIKGRP